MRLAKIAFAAVTIAACPHSLNAEPGPIGRWLMNTPVTLWDRGMDAMDEKAKGLHELEPLSWLPAGMKILGAWVHYDWDNNEIDIFALFPDTPEVYIDHEWCNTVRTRVISRVTGFPEGMTETLVTDDGSFAISDVVGGWFSHSGYQEGDRDEALGEKLARIVFVEVLMQRNAGPGIQCRDRITSLDAPSKPVGE